MKRVLALALAFSLGFAHLGSIGAQTVSAGVITGTVTGPDGPLPGVTVQVTDATGRILGSATTTATGEFKVAGLAAGTFNLNVVTASGAVIATGTATLTEAAMTATVSLNATAAALAGLAEGAVTSGTVVGDMTTTTVLAAAAVAAASIGAVAFVTTNDDASASR